MKMEIFYNRIIFESLKRKIIFLFSFLTLSPNFFGSLRVHLFLTSHTIDVNGDNDIRNTNKTTTTTIFETTLVLTSFLTALQSSPTILEISLKNVRLSVVSAKVSSVDDFVHTIQKPLRPSSTYSTPLSFSSLIHSTISVVSIEKKHTRAEKNNVQSDNKQKHISYLKEGMFLCVISISSFHFLYLVFSFLCVIPAKLHHYLLMPYFFTHNLVSSLCYLKM